MRIILKEVFKSIHHLSPPFMWDLFKIRTTPYNLRSTNKLHIPHANTTRYGLRSLSHYGASLWNTLSEQAKACTDLDSFLKHVDTWVDPPCKCYLCKQ